jgi:amino acid efflux transporter
VLALLLTMGTMNTYVAAAVKLAGALTPRARPSLSLALFALAAAVLLAPLALDALSLDGLMRACSAAFVAVYVTATGAGIRLLRGPARVAAAIAFAAVLVVFAFSGLYVLVPLVIALSSSLPAFAQRTRRRRRSLAPATTACASAASSSPAGTR